ncbi:hypothetical protein CMI37_11950 [Candidatus Pacearchaeota archaeon]|nr:hypothetical protein [Candidatus Pacearchaeota archaeon]
MQKKVFTIINIIALIAIIIGFVFFILRFSSIESPQSQEECVDVNNVASFVHNTCYDAYSKNIIMELERSYDIYNIKSIVISFFDFTEKSYKITDIPNINQTKTYKILAEKNPENINFRLDIIKDFSSPICPEPRAFFVKYCPPGSRQKEIGGRIEEKGKEEYITVGGGMREESDTLALTLVEKERIWQSKCQSQWRCSEWEGCIDGVQRRDCEDIKECFIPTDLPDFTKFCSGFCQERWECAWSECSRGYTTPECQDLSKCGTKHDIPQKLPCRQEREKCLPEITCSEWTECKSDYNFIDLISQTKEIRGAKSRTCVDRKNCVATKYEVKNCSLRTDIYTKRVKKCGTDYIGIYNKLTNNLIAKIEQGKAKDNPYLNIQITDSEKEYCDYCFDGIKNGDEEQVDCGGSCEPCHKKQYIAPYQKPTLWKKVGNWFKKLVS